MECCQKSDISVNESNQNACSWSYAKREGQQLSCKKGNYDLVELLLKECKCRANVKLSSGETPLILACQIRKNEGLVKRLCEILIECGADPEITYLAGLADFFSAFRVHISNSTKIKQIKYRNFFLGSIL